MVILYEKKTKVSALTDNRRICVTLTLSNFVFPRCTWFFFPFFFALNTFIIEMNNQLQELNEVVQCKYKILNKTQTAKCLLKRKQNQTKQRRAEYPG